MLFKGASENSVLLFTALVAAIIFAQAYGVFVATRKARGRPLRATILFLGFMLLWLIVSSIASQNLAVSPMPRVLIFMLGNLSIAAALGVSSLGKTWAENLPLSTLVLFQAFRLPLELVLHEWVEQEVIPTTMTWTGQNFDLITGIVAICLSPLANKFRGVAWIANLVGIGLLFNVARVAVMSSPFPFAWDVQPPLQLAFFLPYSWIIPFCVGAALTGHIVLTRALLNQR